VGSKNDLLSVRVTPLFLRGYTSSSLQFPFLSRCFLAIMLRFRGMGVQPIFCFWRPDGLASVV
jgi:hypothetical protein